MKLKAIIVDDEESARNVLSSLLTRFCPTVEIVKKCSTVLSAVDAIKEVNPDVVFLDIEMPNYAGYELVSFFEEVNFDIIFVTAYDKFALKAFEISAVDYLLKPIEIDRLKLAVNKLESIRELKNNAKNLEALKDNLKKENLTKIIVRQNGDQEIVDINTIIAIEAQESYSCIHTTRNKYMMSKNLKHYESLLAENKSFFRTHKSWLVNLNHLKSYSKSKFEIELQSGINAKLSKYRIAEFEQAILV